MKILYITHTNDQNGSTNALLNIMTEMQHRGNEVALIAPHKEGFLYEEAKKNHIMVFSKLTYANLMIYPLCKLKLSDYLKWFFLSSKGFINYHLEVYKIIKNYKPDIIHTNTSAIDYPLFGSWMTRTPHVWHAREYIDKDFGWKVFPSKRFLQWKMSLKFNHTIAISQDIFNHLKLSKKKDTVIYDGVIKEIPTLTTKTSKLFNFKYFLFVGTLCAGKGVLELIEQFVIFNTKYPDIHLVLACSYEPNDPYFQKCLQQGKQSFNTIHFLGFRKDVYQLMASAQALVVPSKFEGFGFITAEAMFNMTLVIGRNTGGTKEQFDMGLQQTGADIGLRFNANNEIHSLMERAIKENFSEMKVRAYNTVLRNYTSQRNADLILSFYQKILIREKKH